MEPLKTTGELLDEINALRLQLEEANDTIEAIRTGQVDALILKGEQGHELYTLKSADQTYRVFIEKMMEGAVTLNRAGVILYSNSQFAALIGLLLSNVVGKQFHTFLAAGQHERFANLFENGWKEDCKGEIILAGKSSPIVFQLSLTTLELDEGISLSIILTDLTFQKETQLQLKQKNEELEIINHALELSNNDLQQFASVASHDLQEPVRKIQMFSQMIKSSHFDELSNQPKKYLDKIIFSAHRMKALITDILNYSRLSQNERQFEPTDLKELIKELLDDFDMMIAEMNASIDLGDLPVIEVNRGQIRQVFQNLLSNALKFTKQNTPASVSIRLIKNPQLRNGHEQSGNGFCYISVKDNGIGFDQKYADNIFNLFHRLHTKDKYEGTGIGLAITKKIIEKHNGSIIVHSKEGEGSEFIVILPVSQSKE